MSEANRSQLWSRDVSSPEAYAASVEPNRSRLAHLLGLDDDRSRFSTLELITTTEQSALAGTGDGYEAHSVRWPAFADVQGEGLLLTPLDREPVANVVAVPDANVLPEQLTGLIDGVPPESQYARRLAESGCRIVVPTLIDRSEAVDGISNRELLYRSAFVLGRHLLGYELQKILAAIDWFEQRNDVTPRLRTGVIDWGEGGLLALYSAAVDERIDATCVSGYFNTRQQIWREPVERNVFGLLKQFGDAEIASLVAPRTLIVEASASPEVNVAVGEGKGAPCELSTPNIADVEAEVDRARRFIEDLRPVTRLDLVVSGDGTGACGSDPALSQFTGALSDAEMAGPGDRPKSLLVGFSSTTRRERQVHELDRHNQGLLRACAKSRDEFFGDLDCSSLDTFEETAEPYRRYFADEVIGEFDENLLPVNPRTRLAYDEPGWKGYEVVLDVFPGLIAYEILALPDDLAANDQRSVVVCQHGLEGRPQVVVDGSRDAYNDFGAALCKRGFVVFAPQNLYLFTDRFRTLQRKAYPLKKTLFSLIIPQNRQITDWLKTLPYVDGERIGFYGISYGGKAAMRVPPLVDNYCLSICSADFNEWVWKNASTDNDYSYATKGEYEIFEWGLGRTFNYAEMSRLICPRPFMVERGHSDGVAPDETVAHEYAKVKRHYNLLGIGDRTEIEVFVGGHEIHGEGTFRFLHKHLKWPEPSDTQV